MKSPLWNAFYLHSLQLFKFLEQNSIKLFLEADRVSLDYSKDNYGILSSEKNIGYLDKLSVAPKFMHTICQLNSKNDLYQFEELMVQYHDLFIKAVDKEPPHVKFPFIMPRLLDQDVYQININSNIEQSFCTPNVKLILILNLLFWNYNFRLFASCCI